MSQPTIGGHAIIQLSWTGFTYPANAQIVPLLGDESSPTGNAVLQQSALTYRQGAIRCHSITPADKDIFQAYGESHEPVAFVDHDGNAATVRFLDFSSQLLIGDHWEWSATLIEVA